MVRYESVDHTSTSCQMGPGTVVIQCIKRGGCDLWQGDDELSEALPTNAKALPRLPVPKVLSGFSAKNNRLSLQLTDSLDGDLCQLLGASVTHLLFLLLAVS